MTNYEIADHFTMLSKLMDIHGENSFKAKSYASAAFNIEKSPAELKNLSTSEIALLKGIGDSTAKKISELLNSGKMQVLQDMMNKTPKGIIEMLSIKGLGPKKIATIWKEMEIESIGELLYACNENRLLRYKGFGEKTQNSIQESIEFYLGNQGSFLYQQVEGLAESITTWLKKLFSDAAVRSTGAFRRQLEIIDCLEFVVHDTCERTKSTIENAGAPLELLEQNENDLLWKHSSGCTIKIFTCNNEYRDERLFFTTGTPEFNEAFVKHFPKIEYRGATTENDAVIFEQANIPYIHPALRENAAIIDKAKTGQLPTLIQPGDIKGIIHSHSTWSDGSNSLAEMAKACIERGLEYLVISDHSKAAFYANGLSEERIAQQHLEIEQLNQQLAPFRIFKSIECDILSDGSLDYDDEVLSNFDLVIASVHSNLKMTEEKAMQRLLAAIENPYTTILGHMTGRLLLSRNGYPVNHQKIIDACAANRVVIEINAHPVRLDIDWRWIETALNKGVLLSINPDAHHVDGFNDVKYGVLAAQKGGLDKQNNLSSFSLDELEAYIMETRMEKGI
jgi:DNA polymerase (family X)